MSIVRHCVSSGGRFFYDVAPTFIITNSTNHDTCNCPWRVIFDG